MKRLVIFLIRRRLGLRKYQAFRFVEQRSDSDFYFFTNYRVMKYTNGKIVESNVSLNWLLNDGCKVHIVEGGTDDRLRRVC